MKLFSRLLAGVVSAVMLAGMLPGAALAQETTLYTFFHDKKGDSGTWANTIGNAYVSEAEDAAPAKEGAGSYRLKLYVPTGYKSNGMMLYANLVKSPTAYAPDQQSQYLTFWYQPLLKRERIEVGFACGSGSPFGMLRVNLLDYITIDDSEYGNDTIWKEVKIPMADFLDDKKATFYENGTGLTGFNWEKFAGFSIAGSDENLSTDQANFCRIDEVRIIDDGTGGGEVTEPEYPTGDVKWSFVDDQLHGWINTSGNDFVSCVTPLDSTAAKVGSVSQRIKLSTPKDYVSDGTMLYANIINGYNQYPADLKNAEYLALWYQPLLKRNKIEVGFACGSGQGPFAMLRVNLLDYVDIASSEYADSTNTAWKMVKIPMTDFLDDQKATFYANGTGLTAFNWNQFAGFSIAGSDEGLQSQLNFCRIDEVKILGDGTGGGDPVGPEYPKGEAKWTFFDDAKVGWANTSGNEYFAVVDDKAVAKVGSASMRLKLAAPAGHVSGATMLYANIVRERAAYTPDPKSQYLCFWYQPILKRNKVEVGFACGSGSPYGMLRVNLLDYITIQNDEYGQNAPWKLVKIPMADFLDSKKATFYENGTGLSSFNWEKFAGFSLGSSDEGLGNQTDFCRLDEIKIIDDGTGGGDPAEQEYPKGEVKYTFFHDKKGDSGTWANTIGGNHVSETEDATPAKEGAGSYRIKIYVPDGYESNGTMLYTNLVRSSSSYTPDMQKDYLVFWYQPILKRETIEVGITCGSGIPFGMLRVNLLNYINIADSEYGENASWKLVKIPMADFFDGSKAKFYANGTGLNEFDWKKFAGFSIAASDENLTKNQKNFCRLDEVKIINCQPEAQEPSAALSKAVFYDGSGKEITGLSGVQSVSAKLTFENTSAGAVEDAVVMLAVYDAHGALTKVSVKTVMVPAGTANLQIDAVNLSASDHTVKIVGLTNAKGMRPFEAKPGVTLALSR